jgi:hypothetical protein
MSELSFDNISISTGNTSKYMEVGNHIVRITNVEEGTSSLKGTKFVKITVENKEGQACDHTYYLSDGAKNISLAAILTIVAAAQNCDEATAKAKMAGLTTDNVGTIVTPLINGKKIAITLNGEWVDQKDINKKSFIKTVFGSYLFALPEDKFEFLSKKPFVKGKPDNRPVNNPNGVQQVVDNSGVIAPEIDAWDKQ